ncbi:MAG: isoaspartyl peptidase [Oscillospiraceae bacterium]|nr:isoaspartyl peptidase [Oscillospiraceae bacterium]MBQ9836491.1 isoaspartyl peptidase [Oscillospiraceae bacterium]
MTYITRKRAKFMGMTRAVNLPYGTVLPVVGGFLVYEGVALCAVTSEMCHRYFVENTDGCGAERGHLIEGILRATQRKGAGHQGRWDRLWGDQIANGYRREDHPEHWVWAHSFYSARLEDLRHMAKLVK